MTNAQNIREALLNIDKYKNDQHLLNDALVGILELIKSDDVKIKDSDIDTLLAIYEVNLNYFDILHLGSACS